MDNFFTEIDPSLVWFILGLIMLLLEFAMPGLVIFFFGIGAWVVALILLFVDISLNTQLVIFLLTSIGSLLLLRKRFQHLFHGFVPDEQEESSNLEEYKGESAIVVKAIAPGKPGKVEFRGSNWNSEAEVELAEGTQVEIVNVHNLTLVVSPK